MIKFSVLKNKNYKRLYLAGLFSDIGTFITETVFVLFIFGITHFNNAYLGLFKAVYAIGLSTGMIIGSVVGTKFFKTHILIACELARVPLILILFFYHSAWFVIISFGFIAFFTGAFSPNRQALINYFLTDSEVIEANALFSSTYAFLYMVGPLIGSAIYEHCPYVQPVLILDLFTYLIGIICLFKLRIIDTKRYSDLFKNNTQSTFSTLLTAGFSVAWHRLSLRSVLINALSVGIVMGITSYLLLPYAVNVFHRNKADYGIVMAFLSIGGILGGMLRKKLGNIFHHNKLAFFIPFVEAFIMIIAVTYTKNFWIWVFLIMLWGVSVFIRIFAQMNFVSKEVPLDYLGRIHGIVNFTFIIGSIFGAIFVVATGDMISAAYLLKIASVGLLISLLLRLPSRGMRALFNRE